jgi:hypothetical protein
MGRLTASAQNVPASNGENGSILTARKYAVLIDEELLYICTMRMVW